MTLKQQLLSIAQAWRKKAQRVDDKFQSSALAQTQVAVATFESCAEELEEVAKRVCDA